MRSKVVRVLRWLPFCVIGVELVLLLTGVLSIGQAAVIIVTLELALVFIVVLELAAFRAAFQRARKAGAPRTEAMAAAVQHVLPKPVAVLVLQEFRVFGALLRIVFRRREPVADGWSEIPYRNGLRVLVFGLMGISTAAGVAAGALITLSWLRWLLVALAAYWLLGAIGYGALMQLNPHLISTREIRLRLGKTVNVAVPMVEERHVRQESCAGETASYRVADETLVVSVMGKTNVAISLPEPVGVRSRTAGALAPDQGPQPEFVRHIRFFADDPQRVVSVLSAQHAD